MIFVFEYLTILFIMETPAVLALILDEIKKIRNFLATDTLVQGQLSSATQPPNEVPEHVDITWITDYFGISKGTFYNEVDDKLLKAALYISRRPYYLKSDVIKLMTERKEKHLIFRKLNSERKNKNNQNEDDK